MAQMTSTQIDALMTKWMRENNLTVNNCNKADLRAVFVAVDLFLSNNASSMNTAIPQPGRSNLSTAVKASILSAVSEERWGAGTN